MEVVSITIPGPPTGKQRARSGKGHHYTPKKTVEYEKKVATLATLAMKGTPPFIGPVKSYLVAYWPIPSSWPKTKKTMAVEGVIRPGKPDADNIEKIIFDACSNVVFIDDKQIVEWGGKKLYSINPRIEVTFTEI